MAARSSREASLAVARNIISYVGTVPEGTIVDVGCGDGALLHLLEGDRIGISPSEAEVSKLRTLWPDVRFLVEKAQQLQFQDNCISMLFCNSVLLTLETAEEARLAIAQFSRVCRPGALLFLGEIPTEPVRSEYQHDSVTTWLWSLLTRGGPKNFLAGLRDVVKAATSETPLLFYPERWFYCERDQFISLCEALGLTLIRDRTTPHVNFRRDYLFSKK